MSVQNKIDSELNHLVDTISKIALSIERKGVHSSGELSKYADEIDSIVVTNNTVVNDDTKKLDAEYLKKVGLLPQSFSGTPTERDLIVNKFIIQDPKEPLKFYSTDMLTNISIELGGNIVKDYSLNNIRSTEDNLAIDRDKYSITNGGYYINEFSFNEAGTYSVSFNAGPISFKKVLNFNPDNIESMGDFLVYAVNLKSHRNVCYDSKKVESVNCIKREDLDINAQGIFGAVEQALNGLGYQSEMLGYVYNMRTGKADLLDVIWVIGDFGKVPLDFRKSLSTLIYDNKVDIMTNSYSFALLVHGKSETSFISDIDYKEGDTLVFAFYRSLNNSRAHKYTTGAVANYLGSLVSAISSEAV